MRAILAAILAAAIVTPAAAAHSKKTDTVTIKKMHRGAGAYAQHPVPQGVYTQDVYVNGVYIGSDPDWRIRETMRQDARHDKF